jgi:aldehyde dehydrogenase (NAD+)
MLHRNYVDGRWVGTTAVPNINPSDRSDVVGEYAFGDAALVREAVAAARAAFPQWSRSPIQMRFDLLDAVGTEILARKDELGALLAREEGKIVAEATGEVVRAGQLFKFFAGEALRLDGELLPSTRAGVTVEVTREPLGVVGLIAPWNFPIAIPAWKIAPALAYGNCVVFKPAQLVPGSAWALGEIIARHGIPAGAFNLVMGDADAGAALVEAAGVDALSFTGSIAVGRTIAQRAAQRQVRVQLEMGGKNPLVVLDDADLDLAVECALNGAYYSSGQRCTASSRLIVTRGIHDRFVDALAGRVRTLRVGSPLDAQTQMGPVVGQQQLDKVLEYVAIGKSEGARAIVAGERLSLEHNGFYVGPTLFSETHNAMRINREEIFGPVATVIAAADYDEAIAIANDTPFGLSAGICTTSLAHASAFKRDAQAGLVMVNVPTAGVDYHVPFGGRKGSSYGPREQGRYAREFYTTIKTAYVSA